MGSALMLREKQCSRCGGATLIGRLNGNDIVLDAKTPVYFEAYGSGQVTSGFKRMENAYVPHHFVCPRARGLNREWSEPARSTDSTGPSNSAQAKEG